MLRESGADLSFDDFVQRYCPDLGREDRELLQQKITALDSIDRLLGLDGDRTGADMETDRPGAAYCNEKDADSR